MLLAANEGSEKLNATSPLTLGVDIGGTKVAAGLVGAGGGIGFQTRVPMSTQESAEDGFAAVESSIKGVFAAPPGAQSSITGIDICAPGPLYPLDGGIF